MSPSDMVELESLHNDHLKTLGTEAMMAYLLESMELMRDGDILAWKTKYNPKLLPPPAKRKRWQWKSASSFTCVTCQGYMLKIDEGEVCIECGIVDATSTIENIGTNCSYQDRIAPRYKTHRYERLVHFKDYMNMLLGSTLPRISEHVLKTIRLELDGDACSVEEVDRALTSLKLNKKHKKHRYWIAGQMYDEENQPVVIEAFDYYELLKLFCRVEWIWKFHHSEIAPTRKVFLSYPFVFYKLCHIMERPEYTRQVQLLKSPKLLAVHEHYWNKLLPFLQ